MSNSAAPRDLNIRDRGIAFYIFGFLLACYLLTYTGVIQSSDGLAMFATAESIVRRGEIDSNQLLWMSNQQGNIGPDGDLYSRKGLGMTLLAVPLIWTARLWSMVGLAQAALLLNPLLTAWTGGLLFRTGRRLRWSRAASVWAALTFGLATLAWPYTQTLFSDPVCGFGLFAALYGLLSYSQTGRKRYLLGGGLAWGLAYTARVVNLVTLPLYLIALLYAIRAAADVRNTVPPPDRARSAKWSYWLQDNWRPLVSFLAPVVAAGLLSLWWNMARYGSVWDSGYVESERFDAPWGFGIFGLLIGPARGLIWYSPILILAIPGAIWFWRSGLRGARAILVFCASLSAIYVLLYGKWYMWHGGYSWGPRFMVPLMPFLALLAAPAWEQGVGNPPRFMLHASRFLVIALALLSVAVQWLGMLVPFRLAQDWLTEQVTPLFAPETFVQWRYSPLLLQWQFLSPEHFHLTWLRPFDPTTGILGAVDWLGLLIPLSAVVVSAVLLARNVVAARAGSPPARVQNGDLGPRHWLYGIGIALITLSMLTYRYTASVYTASAESELRRAAQRIYRLEQPGDAILFLLPEKTQAFADVYRGSLPLYSLWPQGDLDGEEQEQLDRIRRAHERLWLIPDANLPESSGWERGLRTEDFLLLDTRMAEPGGQRLALYALSEAQELLETGLGTIFGDPALAGAEITEDNGWMRLEGYALTPETHPGGELLLALSWESLRPVEYNYQVFVHLLNASGERLAQRDGQPVQWMRPTSTWQPGEELIDRYAMLLPADLPVGSYSIAVGVYDPVSGQRLPVSAGPGDYAIELGPILVTAEP